MDEIGEDELMWMQINDEILHNECGAIENEISNNNMGANGSACVDDQFVVDREEVPNWVNYKDMHETEDCVDLDDHGAIEVGEENQVSLYEEQDLNEEQHTDPDKDVRGWDDWTRPIIDSDDESENELSRYHKRVRNMKVWDDFTDLRKVELGVYSRFKNAHVFRGVMKHYAADKGFDFLYTRNEPKAIGVICKETDCPFYIWCTTVQGSTDMEIKTCYPDHTCERAVNNEQLTSDFLAKRYSTYIGDNPNINIKSFQKYVHKDLEANVSEYRLYRAIRRARTDMAVDTSVQYAKLYEYLEMVKKTNPDCYWRVEVEHHAVIEEEKRISRFLRMYLRFGPEKKGFIDGCRPFIGIDGCHLKGYYGGQLLSAVAWDANDGMFPLAFAIVEAENKQSWKWFLETLFDDFDNNDQGSWVFISDKQKGLVELFKDWLPNVEHRYCMRHIYENWYKEFKSTDLKAKLWECAKANSAAKFENKMEELKVMNVEAYNWLRQRPAKEWCKAFFTNRAQSNIQTNSLSECYNSWITEGRDLPIINLCEFLRKKMMNRFYTKRNQLSNYKGLVCPDIMLMVEYNKKEARSCYALPSGDGYYEVQDGPDAFTVNLVGKECTCLDWQLSGIPCKHSLAAIMKRKERAESYVSQYYYSDTFKKIYAGKIFPVPGMSDWPTVQKEPLQPPIIQKPPGRPRKNRRRNEAETEPKNVYKASKKGSEMTCSKCNKKGHNKRSCSTKDYGETTSERKQRKKMPSNNNATTNKSRHAEGSNMNHESTKRTRDSQSNTNKVNVQLKREATLKKMEKRRKKMPQQQPNQCNTATECTPQQIESKRQAALQKMASKGQECSTQQTGGEEWRTGIYRTKRKKLQTIRKSLSTQGCNFGSNLPNPPIPACGLAQNELNQCRNVQKSFTMLSGNSSTTTNNEKGNGASKTSRFAVEVLFSRSAKNQAEKGARTASTQPPKRTHASSTICPDPPHCSQL